MKNPFTGKPLSEYFKFTSVVLALLLIIFNQQLGLTYSIILLSSLIWWLFDDHVSFSFASKSSMVKIFFGTAIAYGTFLLLSAIITRTLNPGAFSSIESAVQGVLQLLSANTPILQDSKVLTFIGWGILIPFIESIFFFGILLEGLATITEKATGKRVLLSTFNKTLMVVVFFVAALFTAFHFTSKSLELVPLLITLVFAIVSCLLVIKQQDLRGAVLFHVISNSIVVITAMSVL